jgi:hypothetical protein
MKKFLLNVVIDYPVGSDEILDWVSKEYSPEDVFNIDELDRWATDNDYTKEADND